MNLVSLLLWFEALVMRKKDDILVADSKLGCYYYRSFQMAEGYWWFYRACALRPEGLTCHVELSLKDPVTFDGLF